MALSEGAVQQKEVFVTFATGRPAIFRGQEFGKIVTVLKKFRAAFGRRIEFLKISTSSVLHLVTRPV